LLAFKNYLEKSEAEVQASWLEEQFKKKTEK